MLRAELALLREFAGVLTREQEALVRGELDLLMPLAEDKGRLATALAELAVQRNQILATQGLAKDKPGIDAWLSAHPTVPEAQQDWQDLLALAAQARSQNELNGKLIMTRMQQNQRALAALNAASTQTMLYGPDGQVHQASGSRTFGKF